MPRKKIERDEDGFIVGDLTTYSVTTLDRERRKVERILETGWARWIQSYHDSLIEAINTVDDGGGVPRLDGHYGY